MSSDVSKCDQVVFECMQKVAEVIVSSRVSLHQKQRRDREINSKFSLHVEELSFVRHSMEAWKDDLHMPLGIDVFWQEHQEHLEGALGDAPPSVELLERWDIMYEAQDGVETKSGQLRHLYKRAIILLRTLYAFVRMIPAYQVHERIQKAYDSRDRSLVDTRDDMGFCLYPILDLSRGGLGLDFSGGGSGEKDDTHGTQTGQTASTDCYSFKPLEAPHGQIKIKVTYRRSVDSKAYQHGQTAKNQSSSLAPNMTTSIIQDYVPHDYERTGEGDAPSPSPTPAPAVTAVAGGETSHEQRPRLATMQEDGAMATGTGTGGYRQGFNTDVTGDLDVALPSGLGAAIDAHAPRDSQHRRRDDAGTSDEANLGQGPDVLHWPSPEQGHGYAHKRVNKLPGQGPAPFLTPGPHRHKLVPGGRQGPDVNMEPLDLGPNADVDARDPSVRAVSGLQPSGHGGGMAQNNVEVFGRSVGRRNSDRHCGQCSAEYVAHGAADEFRSVQTPGSLKGYVDRKEEALPEPHLADLYVQDKQLRDGVLGRRALMARAMGEEEGVDATARRFYRRNSICEAPSATPVPREQTSLSVHGNRSTAGHGPDTYALAQRPPASTPPFSYCEEFASARPAGVEADGSPFRLGQPLVSFSPPFDPPCVDPRGPGGALVDKIGVVGAVESPSLCTDAKVRHGSVACTGPRASLALLGTATGSPALLETLPESPFSWKGRRPENSHPPTAVDKSTGAHRSPSRTSPITPGRLAHAMPNKAAGIDPSEGLPFAVEMADEGIEALAQDPTTSVFGGDDGMDFATSLPPTSLFALCSAASSKSDLLMQNSPPMESTEQAQELGFSPERGDADADAANWEGVAPATATSYANAGEMYEEGEEVGKTVRSLEEELDGFRQFHLELERQRS